MLYIVPAIAEVAYRPFPNLAHRNLIQARFELPTLVALLHPPVEGDVLEVGCGRGVALEPLARLLRPRSLTGVDVDPVAAAEAARAIRAGGLAASVAPADVRELPVEARSFDLVVDFGTCYHVADPARALAEVARVLRPGGVFLHETPLAQALSHPTRFRGRLPWSAAPELRPGRSAVFWALRARR